MPTRVLQLIALVTVLAGSFPAWAQEGGDPHLRAVFDRVAPATPGLVVTVRNAPPSAPLLTVRNDTGKRLEMTGFDFEPFLRIGPNGVQANTHSRTFFVTQDPTGTQSVPREARAGATPVWAQISNDNEWGWYEPRARWTGPIPAAARTATEDFLLGPWSVRGRLGETSVVIEGRVVWHPVRGAVHARLVTTTPTPSGVRIAILQGPVPGLVVTNGSGQQLEITSRDATAFARVGPNGVDVNLSSATARDNPKFGRGSGWKHVQDAPVLSWLERRAAAETDEPDQAHIHRKTVFVRWTIPSALGTTSFPIQGVTEWVPVATKASLKQKPGLGLIVLGVAATLLALAVGLFVFARRRSARE